jgi:hypothetical protein
MNATKEPLRPVLYDGGRDVVRILDQRRLPVEEVWMELGSADEVAQAIRDLGALYILLSLPVSGRVNPPLLAAISSSLEPRVLHFGVARKTVLFQPLVSRTSQRTPSRSPKHGSDRIELLRNRSRSLRT